MIIYLADFGQTSGEIFEEMIEFILKYLNSS
jgi:hypothetical protein